MTVRITKWWLLMGAAIVLLGCFGVAQENTQRGTTPLNAIVEGLEQAQAGLRPQVSYQVIREYRLFGANDSSANSDVVAEVDFRPPASKDYRIQKSSGSNRGQQVIRRILDHEVESTAKGNQAHTALSRINYDFSYIGEAILDGQPCYKLGVKPRRKEKDLIAGQVWVDKHRLFVRQIEGEVARTPSWWLRNVRVKLTFDDLAGTWLQTGMEALADVRIFGPHTLMSRILGYRGADEVASTTPACISRIANRIR
jgi:hypothetical protein